MENFSSLCSQVALNTGTSCKTCRNTSKCCIILFLSTLNHTEAILICCWKQNSVKFEGIYKISIRYPGKFQRALYYVLYFTQTDSLIVLLTKLTSLSSRVIPINLLSLRPFSTNFKEKVKLQSFVICSWRACSLSSLAIKVNLGES